MGTKIEWNGAAVEDAIRKGATAGMAKVVDGVRSDVVRSLSRGQRRKISKRTGRPYGLDPSKPGEPPKIVTGALRKSIGSHVAQGASKITGRVGSSLDRASFLELGTRRMAPRPFLRPAAAKARSTFGPTIRDAILQALRRGLRRSKK